MVVCGEIGSHETLTKSPSTNVFHNFLRLEYLSSEDNTIADKKVVFFKEKLNKRLNCRKQHDNSIEKTKKFTFSHKVYALTFGSMGICSINYLTLIALNSYTHARILRHCKSYFQEIICQKSV